MRGKAMVSYLKKRDEKMDRKKDKKRLLKEGQDGDAYIESAFQ